MLRQKKVLHFFSPNGGGAADRSAPYGLRSGGPKKIWNSVPVLTMRGKYEALLQRVQMHTLRRLNMEAPLPSRWSPDAVMRVGSFAPWTHAATIQCTSDRTTPTEPGEPARERAAMPSRQITAPPRASRLPQQPHLRRYSTAIRIKRVDDLAKSVSPTKTVNLAKIMADLEDLENLDVLDGSPAKSGNSWKDAAKCLWPLWHSVSENGGKVKFEELQGALPPFFSLAWGVIGERIKDGKVARLDALWNEERAALLFLRIHGVGPSYAGKWVEAGARTLAGLKKIKLTRAQEIGLRHLEDSRKLIPRAEMDELKAILETTIIERDDRFNVTIAGSYRRGVPFSSDIDVVLQHPLFTDSDDKETSKALMQKVVEALTERKLILDEDRLTLGPKKYSGFVRIPGHTAFRRIDIRLGPFDSVPYMLLASSGDTLLMKLLRHLAKSKGMCLNEYGMGEKYRPEEENPNGFRLGTLRVVNEEREVFELLGVPYLEPTEREFGVWQHKYRKAGIDLNYIDKL